MLRQGKVAVFQIYKFIEFSMICQGIAQKKSRLGKEGEGQEDMEIPGNKMRGVNHPASSDSR